MFHRLTLFDLSKEGKIAAIDKVMATADVPLQQNQQSTHANYTLQQWRWNSPTEEGTMQRVKKHETKYLIDDRLAFLTHILAFTRTEALEKVIKIAVVAITPVKLHIAALEQTLLIEPGLLCWRREQ